MWKALLLWLGIETRQPEPEPTPEEEQVDIREYVYLMHEPLIREFVEKNKINQSEGGGHAPVRDN